jgi:hypothetical protein
MEPSRDEIINTIYTQREINISKQPTKYTRHYFIYGMKLEIVKIDRFLLVKLLQNNPNSTAVLHINISQNETNICHYKKNLISDCPYKYYVELKSFFKYGDDTYKKGELTKIFIKIIMLLVNKNIIDMNYMLLLSTIYINTITGENKGIEKYYKKLGFETYGKDIWTNNLQEKCISYKMEMPVWGFLCLNTYKINK